MRFLMAVTIENDMQDGQVVKEWKSNGISYKIQKGDVK